MSLNPVILAIPMYFTLMAVELVYESISKRRTYRLNDAVTNINAGVLSQLAGTFLALFKIGIYTFVYEQAAVWELPQTGLTFVIALIIWDLCYYWEHRMVHRVNLFWGGHVVHHQSEEYNLSVALRQTSTGFIWGTPFYLPMALLGFHPIQFVLVGGVNLLYQFWIHTEHINKLPRWFEYIFNTPSHHRVHHGRDPEYLDKNYGGILIIWDRLFHSFAEEKARPHYGITTPLKSWNPVYANFAHYINLAGWVRQARSAPDVLRILFKPPGWLPDYLGGFMTPKAVPNDYQKYDTGFNRGVNLYVLVQFLVALGTNAWFFFQQANFPPTVKVLFALWIVWTTLTFGFLFESRKGWLVWLETLRLLCIPAGLYGMLTAGITLAPWLVIAALVFALFSISVVLQLYRAPQGQNVKDS